MKKIILVSSLIMSLIFLVATSYAESTSTQSSYVKILEIQPDLSVPLEVGSDVDFEVKVEYSVEEDSATIDLVIQKGGISPFIGGDTDIITRGQGVVTLKAKVKIPDTKAIQVFTPLGLQGQAQTSIVDSRFYKVVKSKNP